MAGVLVSFFIMKTAVSLIKPSLDELLEKSLSDEVEKEIETIVYSFEGVSNMHDLCTRKIGDYYAMEFAVCMDKDTRLEDVHNLISNIEKSLRDKYGEKTHVMIHVEPIE